MAMKTIKNYKDSIPLKIINMAVEWCIIMVAYFLSALIRCVTPLFMARYFAFQDAIAFASVAVVNAVIAVALYFLIGDYKTIHYRRLVSEASRVLIVQLISGYFISALLYWMKGGQFSRMWMIQYVGVAFILIMIKRILFHHMSDRFFGAYLKKPRTLVIGGGELCRRYVEGVRGLKGNRIEVTGYLADSPNGKVDGWLGPEEKLEEQLDSDEQINEVIITDTDVSDASFRRLVECCHSHGVRVYIIPRFNDYLAGPVNTVYREDIPGLCLFPVDIMRTDNVLGVNVAVTNMEQTISEIADHMEEWRGDYICVSNVHTTVMAYEDVSYRAIQNGAVLALPDGGPLSSHSRDKVNNTAKRVTGPDLMREILKRSGDYGWRHFFYGSTESTLNKLKSHIEANYPGAAIAGMISPPFREISPEEDEKYVSIINEAKPNFVWVGLGAPKQEKWMYEHRDRVHALMIGVGAAFDYESGNIKRAPKWMQNANLEWLYRLAQDPRRLFGRYFSTNLKFLWYTRK